MFKALKDVSKILPKQAERKTAELNPIIYEAEDLIKQELEEIIRQLNEVPDNRLPSPKISKSLNELYYRVLDMMEAEGVELSELPAIVSISEVDEARKMLSLQRYSLLIETSDTVTPFATIFELGRLIENIDLENNEDFKEAYDTAMSKLFTHPQFEASVVGQSEKMMSILKINNRSESNLERNKVATFVQNYESYRDTYNRNLASQEGVEAHINELEAVLYMQHQTQVMQQTDCVPTQDLCDYLDFWSNYLGELSGTEQAKKMVLLDTTNECIRALSAALANSEAALQEMESQDPL